MKKWVLGTGLFILIDVVYQHFGDRSNIYTLGGFNIIHYTFIALLLANQFIHNIIMRLYLLYFVAVVGGLTYHMALGLPFEEEGPVYVWGWIFIAILSIFLIYKKCKTLKKTG